MKSNPYLRADAPDAAPTAVENPACETFSDSLPETPADSDSIDATSIDGDTVSVNNDVTSAPDGGVDTETADTDAAGGSITPEVSVCHDAEEAVSHNSPTTEADKDIPGQFRQESAEEPAAMVRNCAFDDREVCVLQPGRRSVWDF